MTAALPPRLLVLTDRTQSAKPLAWTVSVAVEAGARAVVLREKDLPERQRQHLAAELAAILAPVGGLLILAGATGASALDAGPPSTGAVVGARHLGAADVLPSPRPVLVGRSCHNLAEVAAAAAEGCDYVTVSPVFATSSKPGYGPALGLDGLAELCRAVSHEDGAPPPGRPSANTVPAVYALGGIPVASAAACRAAGARGVAVMGNVMRDPGSVAAYLTALSEVTV